MTQAQRVLSNDELLEMNVNDRLIATGQMQEFDKAVIAKDFPAIHRILSSVLVDEESISEVIELIKGS